MDPINRILKRKKVNFSKLLPFGFKKMEISIHTIVMN